MSAGVIAAHYADVVPTYAAAVLADAPEVYYRHGESVGAPAPLDSSGNGHTGLYTGSLNLGAAGLLTGDTDLSLDFVAGNAGCPGAAFLVTTTAVTFEAIIRPDTVSAGSYNFIGVRDDGNGTGNGWWLVTKATKLTALCRGAEFSGTTTILPNTTYHVAFTYDGTTATIYLNGAVEASSPRTGAMSAAFLDLVIGRWNNGGSPLYFDGRIDEVAYYRTALSAARIAAHAALI